MEGQVPPDLLFHVLFIRIAGMSDTQPKNNFLSPAPPGEEYKLCGRCGKTKPISQYYRNCLAWDGVMSYCKQCSSEVDKIQRKKAKVPGRKRGPTVKHVLVGGEVAKLCQKCGQIKPLSLFNQWKAHWDGYDAICRECKSKENNRRYKAKCMARFNK